ncbi:MAG: hypothetical protein LUB61_00310 [Eggerthellaceae bacterium]|nr:hypothetical protein [Eggerthellaceae bacterium]
MSDDKGNDVLPTVKIFDLESQDQVPVYNFMCSSFGLTGITLLVYARIFSLSQKGKMAIESETDTALYFGVSTSSVRFAHKSLLNKHLIEPVYPDRIPAPQRYRCYVPLMEPLEQIGLTTQDSVRACK